MDCPISTDPPTKAKTNRVGALVLVTVIVSVRKSLKGQLLCYWMDRRAKWAKGEAAELSRGRWGKAHECVYVKKASPEIESDSAPSVNRKQYSKSAINTCTSTGRTNLSLPSPLPNPPTPSRSHVKKILRSHITQKTHCEIPILNSQSASHINYYYYLLHIQAQQGTTGTRTQNGQLLGQVQATLIYIVTVFISVYCPPPASQQHYATLRMGQENPCAGYFAGRWILVWGRRKKGWRKRGEGYMHRWNCVRAAVAAFWTLYALTTFYSSFFFRLIARNVCCEYLKAGRAPLRVSCCFCVS